MHHSQVQCVKGVDVQCGIWHNPKLVTENWVASQCRAKLPASVVDPSAPELHLNRKLDSFKFTYVEKAHARIKAVPFLKPQGRNWMRENSAECVLPPVKMQTTSFQNQSSYRVVRYVDRNLARGTFIGVCQRGFVPTVPIQSNVGKLVQPGVEHAQRTGAVARFCFDGGFPCTGVATRSDLSPPPQKTLHKPQQLMCKHVGHPAP
eukprot:48448-Pyramimonas_sp.AAC.1